MPSLALIRTGRAGNHGSSCHDFLRHTFRWHSVWAVRLCGLRIRRWQAEDEDPEDVLDGPTTAMATRPWSGCWTTHPATRSRQGPAPRRMPRRTGSLRGGTDVSSDLTCCQRADGYSPRAAHCQVTICDLNLEVTTTPLVSGGYTVAMAASLAHLTMALRCNKKNGVV